MHHRNIAVFLYVIIAFLFLYISPAAFAALPGAPTPAEDMPDDLEMIRKSGRIRVAIFNMQARPFVYEENGVLKGADVDMARDIARRLDVTAEFVRVNGSYNDVVVAVGRGEADNGICELSKTLDRSKLVYFTRPYLIGGFYFITNRLSLARAKLADKNKRLSHAELARFYDDPAHTISTMHGSMTVQMVKELFPSAKYATTRT